MEYKDALYTVQTLSSWPSLTAAESRLLDTTKAYLIRANKEVATFLAQAQTARGKAFTEKELSLALVLMTECDNPGRLVAIADKKLAGTSTASFAAMQLSHMMDTLEEDLAARYSSFISPATIQCSESSIAASDLPKRGKPDYRPPGGSLGAEDSNSITVTSVTATGLFSGSGKVCAARETDATPRQLLSSR